MRARIYPIISRPRSGDGGSAPSDSQRPQSFVTTSSTSTYQMGFPMASVILYHPPSLLEQQHINPICLIFGLNSLFLCKKEFRPQCSRKGSSKIKT